MFALRFNEVNERRIANILSVRGRLELGYSNLLRIVRPVHVLFMNDARSLR
jgi:hypothetical protein